MPTSRRSLKEILKKKSLIPTSDYWLERAENIWRQHLQSYAFNLCLMYAFNLCVNLIYAFNLCCTHENTSINEDGCSQPYTNFPTFQIVNKNISQLEFLSTPNQISLKMEFSFRTWIKCFLLALYRFRIFFFKNFTIYTYPDWWISKPYISSVLDE